MNVSMGARLREAREYVCVDLPAAAAAAGIGVEELEALETGEAGADDLAVTRLARAYGYAPDSFLREPEPLDEAGLPVVARLGELMSEHDHEEALRFAAYLRDTCDD